MAEQLSLNQSLHSFNLRPSPSDSLNYGRNSGADRDRARIQTRIRARIRAQIGGLKLRCAALPIILGFCLCFAGFGPGTAMAATPAISSFYCNTVTFTGAGTDTCTVLLSAAATSTLTFSLSSNSAAVTVPASVAVRAGSTTGVFTVTISRVGTAQSPVLETQGGGITRWFQLQLNAAGGSGTGTGTGSGTTYYLSPSGSDSNSGRSASAPWLSPNHSVNCGDVILAAPSSSYSSANFTTGKWGNVSCPAGNNVAWLQCQTFDGCKITATTSGSSAIWVDRSYWGVQGWEATAGASELYGGCFTAMPARSASSTIHHIIFANNIANGCQAEGFGSTSQGSSASVDYFAVIGNIAYNAAQGSTQCYSGISINEPMESDSLAGTHIFVAGNFSYANLDPNPCAGMTATDGQGIIFDTFDNELNGAAPYAAQAMAENNMLLSNGGRGMSVVQNDRSPHATIYIRSNTMWGDNNDPHQNATECGDLTIQNDSGTIATENLIVTNSATGCGHYQIAAVAAISSDASNQIDGNFIYAVNGENEENYSGSFTYGVNSLGVNPNFTNPVVPGAPSCGSASSVPSCMAYVVADFKPKTASAVGYGYQVPSSTPAYDPLFPQWLCTVNLPAGLVTMGCTN
jgi:hypothetical protein